MDTAKLLQEVKAEIARLQKVAELLGEESTSTPQRKGMSASARKRISLAQKARWAKVHAKKAKG